MPAIPILTKTKLIEDLWKITPEDINIEDIAHSLSMQCRFIGQCPDFYSVAQHSIIMSRFDTFELELLLHDAHEAYVGDVVSPIKAALNGVQFRKLTDRIDSVIVEKYSLNKTEACKEFVQIADSQIQEAEKRLFFDRFYVPKTYTADADSVITSLEEMIAESITQDYYAGEIGNLFLERVKELTDEPKDSE